MEKNPTSQNLHPNITSSHSQHITKPLPKGNFIKEFIAYISEIQHFTPQDWIVYIIWIGLIFGLVICTGGFLLFGTYHGVHYPAYAWSIPIGNIIFTLAIAFDTIGHRTRYKEYLKKAEALVHHITIFAGVTSCLFLSIGYAHPEEVRFFIITLIALSILYSVIDEAFHWHRYFVLESDRVEMWSHFFIFFGHNTMVLAWYHWFNQGYPGVKETLLHMSSIF